MDLYFKIKAFEAAMPYIIVAIVVLLCIILAVKESIKQKRIEKYLNSIGYIKLSGGRWRKNDIYI